MKVLIQSIDRYQSTTPIANVVDVEGQWGVEVVVKSLMINDPSLSEDEAKDIANGKYNSINSDERSICIWGDEWDLILTNLS